MKHGNVWLLRLLGRDVREVQGPMVEMASCNRGGGRGGVERERERERERGRWRWSER